MKAVRGKVSSDSVLHDSVSLPATAMQQTASDREVVRLKNEIHNLFLKLQKISIPSSDCSGNNVNYSYYKYFGQSRSEQRIFDIMQSPEIIQQVISNLEEDIVEYRNPQTLIAFKTDLALLINNPQHTEMPKVIQNFENIPRKFEEIASKLRELFSQYKKALLAVQSENKRQPEANQQVSRDSGSVLTESFPISPLSLSFDISSGRPSLNTALVAALNENPEISTGRPLTPQQDLAVVASRTVQAQAWINEFAEQEIVATNTSSQSSAPTQAWVNEFSQQDTTPANTSSNSPTLTQAWIDGHVHVEQPSHLTAALTSTVLSEDERYHALYEDNTDVEPRRVEQIFNSSFNFFPTPLNQRPQPRHNLEAVRGIDFTLANASDRAAVATRVFNGGLRCSL